jgi:hypothetical protein
LRQSQEPKSMTSRARERPTAGGHDFSRADKQFPFCDPERTPMREDFL